MALSKAALTKPTKSNYKKPDRIPVGSYPARLVQIITLGVQNDEWQGETKQASKVTLTFELPTETININGEEQPRWISKEYSLSLHEKSGLTQIVKVLDPSNSWKDLADLLGKPCAIQVGSTMTGNAKIESVVHLMKGMQVAEIYNPAKMLAFDFDAPDLEMFATFPQFMQDKIKSAINYNGFADGVQAKPASKPAKAKPQPAFDEDDDSDVPF